MPNVELNKAEIGLIFTILLENLLEDQQGESYEVIVTGETATTPDLLKKFGDLVIGLPHAEASRPERPEQASEGE